MIAALAAALLSLAPAQAQVRHRVAVCFDENRNEVPCGQTAKPKPTPISATAPGAPLQSRSQQQLLQQGVNSLVEPLRDNARRDEAKVDEENHASARGLPGKALENGSNRSRLRGRYNPGAPGAAERPACNPNWAQSVPRLTPAERARLVSALSADGATLEGGPQTSDLPCYAVIPKGTVWILRQGQRIPSTEAAGLRFGDKIETGRDGYAVVPVYEGGRFELKPNTILEPSWDKAQRRSIYKLLRGYLRSLRDGLGGSGAPMIQGPSAAVAERGTEFSLAAGAGGPDQVTLYSGAVRLDVQQPPAGAGWQGQTAERRALGGGSYVDGGPGSAMEDSVKEGRPLLTLRSGRAHFFAAASTNAAGGFFLATPGQLAVPSAGAEFDVWLTSGRAVYAPRAGSLDISAAGLR